ncbi:hypothetical protein jhhlp_001533 [Lomentospora prolificans]|uniref:UmuC domain-containing protein n=1 Tax=Lomentospora prolificans TaxID=41688 RepID=A0A2N3NIH2_9PEZI|nr:hypothetical protein jhhlp_001533 [Lomentospora prolificans]
MERPPPKPPKRKDDRIILHFDYDCFYASVFENQNPALKSLPLGVKQKGILATCNYVARARGVAKLSQISAARKACPEIVIIDGEDLTPFRDMSKRLHAMLKSHSWNGKVEKLGLDEVFMDVTDIINYNMLCLNRASLSSTFFYLSKSDPESGFLCDLRRFAGCVERFSDEPINMDDSLCVKLLLGSHLAHYLRMKLENDFGFTSTCGISTNKILSKLSGSKHKPRNQTTLLALKDEDVVTFMDHHVLRQVPYIGSKAAKSLIMKIRPDLPPPDPHTHDCPIRVGEVRNYPGMSPAMLDNILGGPGAEKGTGERVWCLLHGADDTEVKTGGDVPTQISIEDTYRQPLESLDAITTELRKISKSLLRRMRVDLVVEDLSPHRSSAQRWIALPRTLRLSINAPLTPDQSYFSRISRSGPLPSFVFALTDGLDKLAHRLVSEAVLPLLKKFEAGKDHKWEILLLNICVTNMALTGSDSGSGIGRDISVMFKTQDEVLRPFRVQSSPRGEKRGSPISDDDGTDEDWDASGDDFSSGEACPQCGHRLPYFALVAHIRYHELGG